MIQFNKNFYSILMILFKLNFNVIRFELNNKGLGIISSYPMIDFRFAPFSGEFVTKEVLMFPFIKSTWFADNC